jgi:hypothetical protein
VPWAGTSYIPEASLFGVATSRGNVWAVGSGQLILSTVDTARDTAPPVTSDDGDRLWHASDVTTNLAAVDVGGEGVARTQYRVDGSPWKDWTGAGITVQAEADHSADGEHKLYYRSTDKAGNTEFPQLCVMRIDTRKPKTASYGDVTVRTGGSARITYKVSDKAPCGSMATVTITIRDAAGAVVDTVALGEQNIGAKLKASFACTLAAGSYTYRVTAVDAAGNPQAAAGTGTLVVRE